MGQDRGCHRRARRGDHFILPAESLAALLAAFDARFGALTVIPTNSSSKLSYGLDAWRITRKLAKPDIVTTQDPFETGLIALFIARRLKVPLHVQVHTDFASREFARHSFRNWLRQRVAWFVLKRAARIRVILGRTADDIAAAGIIPERRRPLAGVPFALGRSR